MIAPSLCSNKKRRDTGALQTLRDARAARSVWSAASSAAFCCVYVRWSIRQSDPSVVCRGEETDVGAGLFAQASCSCCRSLIAVGWLANCPPNGESHQNVAIGGWYLLIRANSRNSCLAFWIVTVNANDFRSFDLSDLS